MGSMWPHSPLILGSEQLHQVVVWVFCSSLRLPSPAQPSPPPPDVVTETLLYQPQLPPTTRKGGSSHGPHPCCSGTQSGIWSTSTRMPLELKPDLDLLMNRVGGSNWLDLGLVSPSASEGLVSGM